MKMCEKFENFIGPACHQRSSAKCHVYVFLKTETITYLSCTAHTDIKPSIKGVWSLCEKHQKSSHRSRVHIQSVYVLAWAGCGCASNRNKKGSMHDHQREPRNCFPAHKQKKRIDALRAELFSSLCFDEAMVAADGSPIHSSAWITPPLSSSFSSTSVPRYGGRMEQSNQSK